MYLTLNKTFHPIMLFLVLLLYSVYNCFNYMLCAGDTLKKSEDYILIIYNDIAKTIIGTMQIGYNIIL